VIVCEKVSGQAIVNFLPFSGYSLPMVMKFFGLEQLDYLS